MIMASTSKFCQSCGMPMKKDPQGGGTNADGTKNEKYCSYCFQDGDFTFKGTVKEFQDFCKEQMIKSGFSKFTAWIFSRGMKRLERWKN